MSRVYFPSVLVGLLIASLAIGCTSDAGDKSVSEADESDEEAELALRMAHLQRWTQKTTLALQARNPELGAFYLHEMEEAVESIQQDVPTYEGYAIADRTESLLLPRVEALEEALEEREWTSVDRRLTEVAQACNECHEATDHSFIVIDLEDVPNPYPQEFAPSEE